MTSKVVPKSLFNNVPATVPQSTPHCAQLLGTLTLSRRLRTKDRNNVIIKAGVPQAPTVYLAAKVGSSDEPHFIKTQLGELRESLETRT